MCLGTAPMDLGGLFNLPPAPRHGLSHESLRGSYRHLQLLDAHLTRWVWGGCDLPEVTSPLGTLSKAPGNG